MMKLEIVGDRVEAAFWEELTVDIRDEVHELGGRSQVEREVAPSNSKSDALECAKLLVEVASASVPILLYFLEKRRRGRTLTLQIKLPNGTASMELEGSAESTEVIAKRLEAALSGSGDASG